MQYNVANSYDAYVNDHPTPSEEQKVLLARLKGLILTLYDLRYYRHVTKFAQDVEDPLCNVAVNKFPFELFGTMGMLLSNLIMVIAFLRMLTIKNKMDEIKERQR